MDSPHLGTVVPFRRSSLEEHTDDELMQLASAGVDKAFAELVRRHQKDVRGYCGRCCGSSLGDDVAQEVFLELWRTRERYEPRGRFRSYLFTIVHTRVLNAVRRRPREVELVEKVHLASGDIDAVLQAERARRIRLKLARLPHDLQQALLLRFAAGLDYAEMAEVLERSQSTVRSRVFHGLLHMRKLLRKEGEP